jgi:hypothetical protein
MTVETSIIHMQTHPQTYRSESGERDEGERGERVETCEGEGQG